jgi:hypothetical protein
MLSFVMLNFFVLGVVAPALKPSVDKRSSLFCAAVIVEEKKFYNLDIQTLIN